MSKKSKKKLKKKDRHALLKAGLNSRKGRKSAKKTAEKLAPDRNGHTAAKAKKGKLVYFFGDGRSDGDGKMKALLGVTIFLGALFLGLQYTLWAAVGRSGLHLDSGTYGSVFYALTLFLVGWVFQFIGHAFERKAPEFFHDWRFLLVGVRWWWAKIHGKA